MRVQAAVWQVADGDAQVVRKSAATPRSANFMR